MVFDINLTTNGVDLVLKTACSLVGGSVSIYFNDKNIELLESKDSRIIDALCDVVKHKDYYYACHMILNFKEYYNCEPQCLEQNYKSNAVLNVAKNCHIVIYEPNACEEYINLAKDILNKCHNQEHSYQEKTPEEKKRSRFEKRRPKRFKELVKRDGYACMFCKKSDVDLIIKRNVSFEDLSDDIKEQTSQCELRCRKCHRK